MSENHSRKTPRSTGHNPARVASELARILIVGEDLGFDVLTLYLRPLPAAHLCGAASARGLRIGDWPVQYDGLTAWLRSRREFATLSANELAAAAGVSARTIRRLENGDSVSIGTIVKVALALDLSTRVKKAGLAEFRLSARACAVIEATTAHLGMNYPQKFEGLGGFSYVMCWATSASTVAVSAWVRGDHDQGEPDRLMRGYQVRRSLDRSYWTLEPYAHPGEDGGWQFGEWATGGWRDRLDVRRVTAEASEWFTKLERDSARPIQEIIRRSAIEPLSGPKEVAQWFGAPRAERLVEGLSSLQAELQTELDRCKPSPRRGGEGRPNLKLVSAQPAKPDSNTSQRADADPGDGVWKTIGRRFLASLAEAAARELQPRQVTKPVEIWRPSAPPAVNRTQYGFTEVQLLSLLTHQQEILTLHTRHLWYFQDHKVEPLLAGWHLELWHRIVSFHAAKEDSAALKVALEQVEWARDAAGEMRGAIPTEIQSAFHLILGSMKLCV